MEKIYTTGQKLKRITLPKFDRSKLWKLRLGRIRKLKKPKCKIIKKKELHIQIFIASC